MTRNKYARPLLNPNLVRAERFSSRSLRSQPPAVDRVEFMAREKKTCKLNRGPISQHEVRATDHGSQNLSRDAFDQVAFETHRFWPDSRKNLFSWIALNNVLLNKPPPLSPGVDGMYPNRHVFSGDDCTTAVRQERTRDSSVLTRVREHRDGDRIE